MADHPNQITPFDAKEHLANITKFPEVEKPRNQ
jgi:hypothetical protein